MKIRHRIWAVVLLFAVAAGQGTQLAVAAEYDTVIYHYVYSDYNDGNSVVQGANITREPNDLNWQNGISPSWGTPTKTMVGTVKDVWWFASSKSINNASKPASNPGNYVKNTVEQNFATVRFDKDEGYANTADDIIELILDYGALLAGAGNGTPYMKLPVSGMDAQGNSCVLAMPVMNGTSFYFEGAPQGKQEFIPKITVDGGVRPGQRTYIQILFDMRNQTYSAACLKKSQTGDTAESEAQPQTLVRNAPFYETTEQRVNAVSKFDILMKYQTGSDLFAPVEIKLTKLGEQSVHEIDQKDIEAAKTQIDTGLSEDEANPTIIETGKLPVSSAGIPIRWQSDSAFIAISEDGALQIQQPTAQQGDQTACITACFEKGKVSDTIRYYVKIKAEEAPAQSKLSIGDYLAAGSYNEDMILWRCVDIDKNGALMLSDRVLSVKPFDFAGADETGSHKRGYQAGRDRKRYGSNYWKDSNIRCWLNAREGAGNVVWTCANPPACANGLTTFNSYAQEAGFLNGFSEKDCNAIKKTVLVSILDRFEKSSEGEASYLLFDPGFFTILQNYNTAFSEEIEETVFLPDIRQISRIYHNSSVLGDKYYVGKLTEKAAQLDGSHKTYPNGFSCAYWLRTPSADGSRGYKARVVYAQNIGDAWVGDMNVGASIGVRPAFYFNEAAVLNGSGTKEAPYVLQ